MSKEIFVVKFEQRQTASIEVEADSYGEAQAIGLKKGLEDGLVWNQSQPRVREVVRKKLQRKKV